MEGQPKQAVRITLLEVLVAVALTGAIEELFRSQKTGDDWWALATATLALGLTTINFYHGKVATQLGSEYQRAKIARPMVDFLDFWLNILVIVCLNCLAFTLHEPAVWLTLVYLLRAIDSALVIFTLVVADESDAAIRRAQWTWLAINIGFVAALATAKHFLGDNQGALARVFLTLTLIDIVIDYSLNRDLFFSGASSWSEYRMAKLWDEIQKDPGLEDSQKAVRTAHDHLTGLGWRWQDKRVLDMGCGNGWLSRWLHAAGARVVGIDQSKPLIAKAKKRPSAGIAYEHVDFTSRQALATSAEYDAIMSLYSIQDCRDIGRAFKFVAQNLTPGGFLIAVFEDDRFLRGKGRQHSMSMRRWLNERRQLICWKRAGDDDEEWDRRYVTITNHWGRPRYCQEAMKRGLEVEEIPTTLRFTVLKCTKPASPPASV